MQLDGGRVGVAKHAKQGGTPARQGEPGGGFAGGFEDEADGSVARVCWAKNDGSAAGRGVRGDRGLDAPFNAAAVVVSKQEDRGGEGCRESGSGWRIVTGGPRTVVPRQRIVIPGPRAVTPGQKIVIPAPRIVIPAYQIVIPAPRIVIPAAQIVIGA